MEEGDVPVFDPLDAYSMSLVDHLHQPGAPHAVQHFQASDAANNHAGGVHAVNYGQFVPMQTEGVNLIPLEPSGSIPIHYDNNTYNQDHTTFIPSSLPKHLKQPLSLAEIQDYRPQLHPITNGSGGLQIKIPTTQQRSPRGALLSPGGLVISPGAVVPGLSTSPGNIPGGLSISPGSNIRISPVAQLHHVHPPPSYQEHITPTENVQTQHLRIPKVPSSNAAALSNSVSDAQMTSPVKLSPNKLMSQSVNSTPANSPKLSSTNVTPVKALEILSDEEIKEFADIPGINLKKKTVDSNIYINNLVSYHHSMFANIDSYAERCMACVFRKLKNNLRDLQKLSRAILNKDGSRPGLCISVPRSKDCRITVTRSSQDGTKSTKKIHPHLALVQIFSNPQALNVNVVEPIPECKSPFVAGSSFSEMCINPYHYFVTSSPTKLAAKRPGPKPKSENSFVTKLPKKHLDLPDANDSDSDCLSESCSDSGTDWEQAWTDSLQPGLERLASKQEREGSQPDGDKIGTHHKIDINESDLTSRIEFLHLKRKSNGGSSSHPPDTVPTSPKVLKKLHVLDDMKCLIRCNYDLNSVATLTCDKPRTRTRKLINIQKKLSNPDHSDPQLSPSRKANNCRESNDSLINNIATAVPEVSKIHQETPKNKVTDNVEINTKVNDSSNVKVKTELRGEYTEEKKKQDELVIKDLLDNIKESFESQFDMDLDQFSERENQFYGQELQGFSITNTFSMSDDTPQEPSQDSIGLVIDESVSQADETFEDNTDPNAIDNTDANDIDDDGGGETVPLIVDAWSDVNNQQQGEYFGSYDMMYDS